MRCAATTTIREALCPNWPHPGITGCSWCVGAEQVGALDALASLEHLVEAVEHVLKNGEQGKQSRRRLGDALKAVK